MSELEQADAALRGGGATSAASETQLQLWAKPGSRHGELLGSLVHAALERIDLRKPFALELLANDVPGRIRGAERERLLAEAARSIESFLKSDLARRIGSARVLHRELEFLLRHDDPEDRDVFVSLSGTIDCLFQSADGFWELVDYKTGAALAASPDEHLLAEYEFQLGVYALALRQLIGRVPDRIALAILGDSPRMVEYRPHEGAFAALEVRIARAIVHMRQTEPRRT